MANSFHSCMVTLTGISALSTGYYALRFDSDPEHCLASNLNDNRFSTVARTFEKDFNKKAISLAPEVSQIYSQTKYTIDVGANFRFAFEIVFYC